ncbi:MAG: TetR/AcrR family transcriptional regulator [Sphingomonadaceae bacterium]|jgi:TetR/AcrR family transcriptional repressor for divergent bdcA
MSETAAPPAMTEEPAAPRGRGRPRQFNIDRATESCDALFRSRGYDRVTLQDLTGAIGINPPSFYAAFGNKALLFIRIADSYSNDWLGEVRRTFDEEPNLADALETIVLSAARRFAWREQETDDGHRHGWGGCLLLEAANNCSDVGVTAHLRKARLSIAAALYRGISRTAPERVVELTDHVMTLLVGFSAMGRDGVGQDRLVAVASRTVQSLCDSTLRV